MRMLVALIMSAGIGDTVSAHGPVREFLRAAVVRTADRVAVARNRVATFVRPVAIVPVAGVSFVNPVVAAPAAMPLPMTRENVAGLQATATGRLHIAKRIAEFRAGVKAELERRGIDPASVKIVGQIGDGKILEWIILHGPDIIKFVEMLIALFG